MRFRTRLLQIERQAGQRAETGRRRITQIIVRRLDNEGHVIGGELYDLQKPGEFIPLKWPDDADMLR